MRRGEAAARDDDIGDDEDKVFLTEAEFALLRDCAAADSRNFLTVAVGTGLRFGEITALMVKDLALESTRPTLTGRQAWKRNGTGGFAGDRERYYLGKPKTRESRWRISLSPTVAEIQRGLAAGKQPDDLVFTAPARRPARPSALVRRPLAPRSHGSRAAGT